LKEGQSLDNFISEVEEKVDAMVGESTLNQYKSFKALVKHKRRVNRVFSELSVEIALRSRPPDVDKKVLAVAVAACSAAPPKAPRKKTSKNRKGISEAGDISSSTIRLERTKSLESSKMKRKASDSVSDAEAQVASSLAQLIQKKAKKVVKKISVATVQRVPSAFSDDEMTEELRPTCFSSCLWCDLRFNVRRSYTTGSENEFVDVETFSDDVLEVQEAPTGSVAAVNAEASVLLLPLMLRLIPPKLLNLKTELLPNLMKTWSGQCKEVMIPLKPSLWLRHAKNFPKVRTLLLQLMPTMRVSVHPLRENC
jgi:hypothetical protein